jgi:hypothetical protein
MGIGQKELLVIAFSVILFTMATSIPNVDAKKSSGTYLSEIGSTKVCGDMLCDEPISIKDKISLFLESKGIGKKTITKQSDRFSIGPSQQSIEKTDLLTQGKYVNDSLGFSIKPFSFDNVDEISNTANTSVIKFTSSETDYQIFPPYFTVTIIDDKNLVSPFGDSFSKDFIKNYVSDLESNDSITKVEISEREHFESLSSYGIIISGEITNNLKNNLIQTKFSTFFLFEDSRAFSITLNSSIQDHTQHQKQFLKSLETFTILSDPTDGISEKSKNENTPSGKQKEKKNK